MIVASLHKENTWYIFRKNGVEVEVEIDGTNHFSTHELNKGETNRINKLKRTKK